MSEGEGKARYFTFLVWPESAPPDWRDRLKRSHGAYAISPLHEPDEEQSKPHYHVVYRHPNTVSLNGAKAAIPSDVPGNGYIEPVRQPGNMQRYLIHLDDPEKQQFPEGINAIDILGGFPLDLSRELSKAEKNEIRNELLALIRDNGVIEYSTFIFALMKDGNPDKLDYACNHTILFEGVIRSQRHKGVED